MISRRALLFTASLAVVTGCGYHVTGASDLLPKHINTIYIPAFTNVTTRYTLSDKLPEALAREFLARTRYRVVSDESQADAVLRGGIANYYSSPVIYDPVTSRASTVQIGVVLQVSLYDRAKQKVLYKRDGFEVRQRYEIAALQQDARAQQLDRNVYFDESEPALDRLSREAARSIVSALLENF